MVLSQKHQFTSTIFFFFFFFLTENIFNFTNKGDYISGQKQKQKKNCMQHEQIQSNLTPQHDPKCHSKNIKTENVLDKLFKRVSSSNKQNIKKHTRNIQKERKRRKSRTECQTKYKLVNKVEHHLVLWP